MRRIGNFITLFLLETAAIVLIGMQIKLLGWVILILGFILLFFCEKQWKKDFVLIYLAFAFLGITPITTNISYMHILQMGIPLMLAVSLPYMISRYVYKDSPVGFPFINRRSWYSSEILYIFVTALIAYFLIPFYLKNSGAYHNWTVNPGFSNLLRLFLGTNFLGIWDELFFICTVLGILKRHMPFVLANILQSILFSSFLYELGFRGWGWIMIGIFALVQGYIFQKTESLLYVITIHVTLDFILYLALIHAYYPTWIPIFIS